MKEIRMVEMRALEDDGMVVEGYAAIAVKICSLTLLKRLTGWSASRR